MIQKTKAGGERYMHYPVSRVTIFFVLRAIPFDFYLFGVRLPRRVPQPGLHYAEKLEIKVFLVPERLD